MHHGRDMPQPPKTRRLEETTGPKEKEMKRGYYMHPNGQTILVTILEEKGDKYYVSGKFDGENISLTWINKADVILEDAWP